MRQPRYILMTRTIEKEKSDRATQAVRLVRIIRHRLAQHLLSWEFPDEITTTTEFRRLLHRILRETKKW